jgi:hypothetical protein
MGLWRQIGLLCFFVLAIAGLCIDIGYGFYKVFDTTSTTGVYYIDDQNPVDIATVSEENLTQEQINEYNDRYFFEANVYSNENKNGIILQELNLHYFTNPTLTVASTLSTGMQYTSDYDGKNGLYDTITVSVPDQAYADNFISPRFEYYETTNGLSWDAVGLQTQLNRNTRFIIKIGGEAYHIQLTGKFEWDTNDRHGEWYTLGIPIDHITHHIQYYTYADIFKDIMHGVLTNSLETGTHYATVNLSKYFTVIDHYNTATAQWEATADADYITSYCAIKFHYDRNGAISKEQSLYEVINDDPRFNLTQVVYDTEYWQERLQYTLDANDLSYRFSSTYNGYFASLPLRLKTMFASMPKAEVSIVLDLTDEYLQGKKIVGFDYNAFENFEIKNITITNGTGDFYLLTNALAGTHYKNFTHENLEIMGVA